MGDFDIHFYKGDNGVEGLLNILETLELSQRVRNIYRF